jgi:hypothetical protein
MFGGAPRAPPRPTYPTVARDGAPTIRLRLSGAKNSRLGTAPAIVPTWRSVCIAVGEPAQWAPTMIESTIADSSLFAPGARRPELGFALTFAPCLIAGR